MREHISLPTAHRLLLKGVETDGEGAVKSTLRKLVTVFRFQL